MNGKSKTIIFLAPFMLNFSYFQSETINGVEEEVYFFRVTEAVFVGWFTLEYTIRFFVSPIKVSSFLLSKLVEIQ